MTTTTTSSTPPTRLTAFHRKHVSLKAIMNEHDGWVRAERYTSADEEVNKVLNGAGVSDISPLGKVDAKGMQLDALLEKAFSASSVPKKPGEVKRVSGSSSAWEKLHMVYACRLARDHALLVTSPFAASSVLDLEVPLPSDENVYLTNVTSSFAGLNLAGPQAVHVLRKLTAIDVSTESFRNLRCAEGGLAEVYALVVRNDVTYSGKQVASYDLYFGRDYAGYVWDAIIDAGREVDITPFGLTAHEMLHSAPQAEGKEGSKRDVTEVTR